MQQILLGILMAIVSLYQNPKVQSDPAMLAQVNAMFVAVSPLMQEAIGNQTSTISFDVPTSTDQTQPIVINVNNPPAQPVQTSTPSEPVLGSAATSTPSSTPVLGPQTCSISPVYTLYATKNGVVDLDLGTSSAVNVTYGVQPHGNNYSGWNGNIVFEDSYGNQTSMVGPQGIIPLPSNTTAIQIYYPDGTACNESF